MGMFTNFFEQMSGTSKQSYAPSLHDPKEYKKWQKEQDKRYKDIGSARDRYGEESKKWMGRYDEGIAEADRYRGLAETDFGRARDEIQRAKGTFSRAGADITRARQAQGSASALMADRDHYASLKDRADQRRRGIQGDRLEMQSLRGRLGRPAEDTGMTQRLMDAFKGANEGNREMMEANTALLAKTNPAAAARMQEQFNESTLKSIGQLKQQGMVTDQQLSDNNLTREAGMLMDSTALYGQESAQDQMMAGYHQQQIQNYGAAATQNLNIAGAQGNIARGYLAGAEQYGALGGRQAGMASQLDARAGTAMGAGLKYEGMGYGALQDLTSIANKRVERQDKFRMSDAAARARVDSFNRSRAQRGVGNVMKVAEIAARTWAAGATAGGSELAIAALKAKQANDMSKTTKSGRDSTVVRVRNPNDPMAPVSNVNTTGTGINPGNAYGGSGYVPYKDPIIGPGTLKDSSSIVQDVVPQQDYSNYGYPWASSKKKILNPYHPYQGRGL